MDKKILYSAVVLTEKSRSILLARFAHAIPAEWKVIAHHMTIAFGQPVEDETEVGKEVELQVEELGVSPMAIAVKVSGYPSKNTIPHITIAVNEKEGGKPVMSNQITDWIPVKSLPLRGIVTNVTA